MSPSEANSDRDTCKVLKAKMGRGNHHLLSIHNELQARVLPHSVLPPCFKVGHAITIKETKAQRG